MNRDLTIYGVHAAFWSSFGFARWFLNSRKTGSHHADAPKAKSSKTAPYSRVLVVFHGLAFGLMYHGIGQAVFGGRVPHLFPFQRLAATAVIAAGTAAAYWALISLQTWRLRAKIEAGHELATDGPFAFIRHPIYLALDLLAVGTALWIPTMIEAAAVALMLIGSDLRARAEEKILVDVFGERYRAYSKASRRFIPGIY